MDGPAGHKKYVGTIKQELQICTSDLMSFNYTNMHFRMCPIVLK